MTENTPPASTEDPSKAAGGTAPPPEPKKDPGTSGGAKADDDSWLDQLPEERKEYVKKLRSEAAYRRKTATEAESKLSELQAKIDQAEQDKLKEQGEFKKLYEGEQQKLAALHKQLLRQEIKVQAQKEGLIDLDLAELISGESVKINEAGQVAGAETAVSAFKALKPHLFQAPASAAPAPRSTSAGNEPPVRAPGENKRVTDLSPEEYKKSKAEFLKSS